MVARENIIRILVQAAVLAALFIWVFPFFEGNRIGFFSAFIIFVAAQILVYAFSRFLLIGNRSLLFLSVIMVGVVLLMISGLADTGI